MPRWECYRCSYVTEADSPPEECPSCHYSVAFWIEGEEPAAGMTVKGLTRTSIFRLDHREPTLKAAKLMKEQDTENILVTVSGEVKGMVTERDIVYKVAAADRAASKVPLSEVMSTPIYTIESDATIPEAIRTMARHHIRRLVVTEGGKMIGIISQRSIIGGSFRSAGEHEQEPLEQKRVATAKRRRRSKGPSRRPR